jgi:DNA-binding MarR family transcriptional regulator
VSFRSADEIRSHPRFQEAYDCFVDELLSLYGDDRRLLRSLVEYVRAVSFMIIVCLDALYDPDDPSTYVTLARLRTALAPMGITDGRRVADLVDGLELDRFLTRSVSPRDRRAHILRPTEKMLAADREWLAAFHAPLALLYPENAAYQAAMARDPVHQAAYRKVSLSTVGFAEKIVGTNPAIGLFLSHDVGIRVLMVLMSMVRGKTPPRAPFGFYTTAAERAGVSRTHVRNILRSAAGLGLVTLPGPAGRFVEVLPPLEEAVARWIADSLSGIDLVCALAKAEPSRLNGRSSAAAAVEHERTTLSETHDKLP